MTDTLVPVACTVTGFSLGLLVSWSALAAMPPDHRDAFLKGALDGMSPVFWWRKLTRQ